MAFRIRARTLLELGAELISSDALAIYELVKNSIDAGSPTVRITVQSILQYSRYRQALELADGIAAGDEGDAAATLAGLKRDVEGWLANDSPPGVPRAFMTQLGQPSTVDKFKVALAGAYEKYNFIEVSDEGEGMGLEDLGDAFLTIGTRSRRREKSTWDPRKADPERMLLGDKGVGRLSAMRLGDRIDVRTSKKGEKRWSELGIDWRRFSHDSDDYLEDVEVAPVAGGPKDDAAVHGTTIRMSALKTDWTRQKFADILRDEFSRMVDPFDRRKGNRLFRIYYNGNQVTLPQIQQRLFETAHAVVTARFEIADDRSVSLTGEIDYRLNAHRKFTLNYREAQLVSITSSKSLAVIRNLGSFKVEFLWFNRLHLTAVEGLGTKSDVQGLVRQWAGGLMVFRDGFRINPYGGPDDDWLHLDKKAFQRSGYKLNRQQVIGRVNLSWRNRYLVEQTNREGLVDNEYKDALVAILQKILEDFFSFSTSVDAEVRQEDLTSMEVLKNRVKKAKTDIQRKIREIAVNAPEQAGPLQEVERLVQTLAAQIDGVDAIVDDYKDERRKFVHLAGLGLMVELILHELGRSSSNTLSTLEGIDPSTLPGRLPAVFSTLEAQLKTLQKRIETLDPLSTARRQVKEFFVVNDLIAEIVDARNSQAERHKVSVKIIAPKTAWRIRAVRGMVIQIVENLLANSFYWLKQRAILEPKFKPQITIELDPEGRTISVTDNGPGVEPSEAELIFKPFHTSKPPGEGSGLGLYIGRELAEYHDWTLAMAQGSGKLLNTFVLDLSGGK